MASRTIISSSSPANSRAVVSSAEQLSNNLSRTLSEQEEVSTQELSRRVGRDREAYSPLTPFIPDTGFGGSTFGGAQQQPATGGLFGAANTANQPKPGGFSFGQPQQAQQQPAASPFGARPATGTFGGFGANNSTSGGNSSFSFGEWRLRLICDASARDMADTSPVPFDL